MKRLFPDPGGLDDAGLVDAYRLPAGRSLRVVVNLADEPREIDLDRRAGDVLFATGELPALDGATVTLPAESAAVLRIR